MIHTIVSATDNNSRGDIYAVLSVFIDWEKAYSHQCHTLGVKSFIENGVRPSLIPLLINYFQNREMQVKWHGQLSKPRKLPGSGAQGASLGNWEFLSQTNHNADSVPQEHRFKYIDDLTILEIINLLNIGIASFNIKHQVPNDIPTHGQYIPNESLKSQGYLDNIDNWTESQLMKISQPKTKAMIYNFTQNYQFTTRLELKGANVDIVDSMKVLGTIITNTLSWDKNCDNIVRKINARMQLLREVWRMGSTVEEMVHLWIIYCRSVAEQSCVVWAGSLTVENKDDLERTQKSFAKLVLQDKYSTYKSALI